MWVQTAGRTFLQILAIGTFGYQMMMAISKFNTSTVLTTSDWREISADDMPTITLCALNQYDAIAGAEYGLHDLYLFATGRAWGWTEWRSWDGKGNLTYREMVDTLFNASYESIQFMTDDGVRGHEDIMEDKFILPYGNCKNIITAPLSSGWWFKILFGSDEKFGLFVTNSLETTNISIAKRSMEGETLRNSGRQEGNFFVLELTEKYRMPGHCQKYGAEEAFSSFTACKESADRQVSISEIKCMVPWMSKEQQCQEINSLKIKTFKEGSQDQFATLCYAHDILQAKLVKGT